MNEAILAELRELRALIKELTERIADHEKRIADMEPFEYDDDDDEVTA
jgi:hypothetical protein